VREGDSIVFDVERRTLEVEISASELATRLRGWAPRALRYTSGVFAKYAALVSSAAEGAVTLVPASSNSTPKEAKEVNDGHHLHR